MDSCSQRRDSGRTWWDSSCLWSRYTRRRPCRFVRARVRQRSRVCAHKLVVQSQRQRDLAQPRKSDQRQIGRASAKFQGKPKVRYGLAKMGALFKSSSLVPLKPTRRSAIPCWGSQSNSPPSSIEPNSRLCGVPNPVKSNGRVVIHRPGLGAIRVEGLSKCIGQVLA